ncbi:MAG TPA: dockerin type I domain-containing protein, partial [Tepidisphaeraceae bacterium]|nr:dockerin type I domain-containing protein [Tepidisphaeraceae bacterium]
DENSVSVRNIQTNQLIPSASLDLQFDPQTHEATLTFPGLADSLLDDGNWRMTINGQSVRDQFGNQLDGNSDGLAGDSFSFDFYTLAGDVNRDRTVNFSDLLIVAQMYNTVGNTFSSGNVDYSSDGLVDFNDLLIMAQEYGNNLPIAFARSPIASAPRRISDDVLKSSNI